MTDAQKLLKIQSEISDLRLELQELKLKRKDVGVDLDSIDRRIKEIEEKLGK